MAHLERIVVLVDMDCFYCQVEEKLNPDFIGKPLAVVQYNTWKGGGIIAVNYPARDKGVTRHMRGDEARAKCPEIILCRVPNVRGKADLTKYREAGKRVAEVLQTFNAILERASVDEAYMDITEAVNKRLECVKGHITREMLPNTYVVEASVENFLYNIYNDDIRLVENLKLAMGAVIVEEIRAAVYNNTGYRCSAGIAHNKILAKLCCGMNKPNKQTVCPQNCVEKLYRNLPVRKIKSLGGKFGCTLTEGLDITNMGQLIQFSKQEFLQKFDEKTANWLFNIARGIDLEPVTVRLISKSIGCCKKFPGKSALTDEETVRHWLSELCQEIAERLQKDMEENNRKAKQIIVSFVQGPNNNEISTSKSCVLNTYEAAKITNIAFEVLKKCTQKSDGSFLLKFLGLSVGKFEDCKNVNSVANFFFQAPAANNSDAESKKRASMETSETDSKVVKKKKSDISSYFISQNQNSSEQKITESANVALIDPFLNEGVDILKGLSASGNKSEDIVDRAYLEDTTEIEYGEQELKFYDDYVATSGKPDETSDLPNLKVEQSAHEAESFFTQCKSKMLTEKRNETSEDSEDSIESELFCSGIRPRTEEFESNSTNSKSELWNATVQLSAPEPKPLFVQCKSKMLAEKLKETSEDSEDSIGSELFCSGGFRATRTEEVESDSANANSYFLEYFSNMKKCNAAAAAAEEKPCSPADRNFNTSRILTENELEVAESSDEEAEEEEEATRVDKQSDENAHTFRQNENHASTSRFEEETLTFGKEKCLECGKSVCAFEMTSHMDYHFALKIVRQESKLYQQNAPKTVVSGDAKSKSTKTKSAKTTKKRNRSPAANKSTTKSIVSFLQAKRTEQNCPGSVLGDAKRCPECDANVPETEFFSHLDFHAAKKLHLELNSNSMNASAHESVHSMQKTGALQNFATGANRDTSAKLGKSNNSSKKKCDNSSKKIPHVNSSLSSFFKPI